MLAAASPATQPGISTGKPVLQPRVGRGTRMARLLRALQPDHDAVAPDIGAVISKRGPDMLQGLTSGEFLWSEPSIIAPIFSRCLFRWRYQLHLAHGRRTRKRRTTRPSSPRLTAPMATGRPISAASPQKC